MTRNFDRRIELLFEIARENLKEELLSVMDCYWKDTAKARILTPQGEYVRPAGEGGLFNAQERLLGEHPA
jgi:polyphosphate kinase